MSQYAQLKSCYTKLKEEIYSFMEYFESCIISNGIDRKGSSSISDGSIFDGDPACISEEGKDLAARMLQEIRDSLKEMDSRLIENYINFEEICDNLPDAIYVADRIGTTIYVNDMYSKMSDIPKEDVIGENVHHINEEKKLYTNGIIPVILKHKERREQVGVMNRTGIKVYITGFPIFDENHELKYAVAHDKDIQQLETMKDQLITLKTAMDITENEAQYLRKQQIKSEEIVCRSQKMYYALDTVAAVAPTDATVLITGESGTGKEMFANEIYKASSRSAEPFLKINCAAIPESLMESELFGYEPGTFTGANKKGKTGIFELVNHGTLMLDEIGEMSLAMQSKLLRVLQNHEFRKIGGSRPISVDVRIIAATNKDLLVGIQEKTFREDLYYRLNVVPIHIPPLRERLEEIESLTQHFLDKYNKKYNKHVEIYSDAVHLMETYRWPGNVRELENVIERMVVISPGDAIDRQQVARVLGISDDAAKASREFGYDLRAATAAVEKHLIQNAMEEYGSGRKAAAALGIDHSTLIKKCRRYGIG